MNFLRQKIWFFSVIQCALCVLLIQGFGVPKYIRFSRNHLFVEAPRGNDGSVTSSMKGDSTPHSIGMIDYIRNRTDLTIMSDHKGIPITVDRMLATKPLRSELMARPGPGGRSLTYLSGDSVTRNLNDIFGFNQWNLQILRSEQTVCTEVENPRGGKMWHVLYSTHVRITHKPSGCFREDIGCGDLMDRNLVAAIQNAVKASVTDAMKRAARHFGDKLGNSLYDSEFNIQNAPLTLSEALDLYDEEYSETKLGR